MTDADIWGHVLKATLAIGEAIFEAFKTGDPSVLGKSIRELMKPVDALDLEAKFEERATEVAYGPPLPGVGDDEL